MHTHEHNYNHYNVIGHNDNDCHRSFRYIESSV